MDQRLLVAGLAAVLLLAAVGGGLLLASTVPSAGSDATTSAALAWTPPLVVDFRHRAGEPNLRIDHEGRIYAGAPCGLLGCNQGWFWRSLDRGATWEFIHHVAPDRNVFDKREWRLSVAPGGGDSDIAVTPGGRIYYADLYSAEISVSRSDDAGVTWLRSHPAVSNVPIGDRPWIAVHGEDRVFVGFNQVPYGPMVTRSVDGGLTWTTHPATPPHWIGKWWTVGNIVANPRDGTLVFPHTACDDAGRCAFEVWASVSRDGGLTWTQHLVRAAEGDTSGVFPAIAQDRWGFLYVAWSEERAGGSRSVYVASSGDLGLSWSEPALVSGDLNAVMPWVVAGSRGRVGVA